VAGGGFATAAAEVGGVLFRLLASLGINRDLAYRYPAVVAGVGVVLAVMVSCCREGIAGWRYDVIVHSFSSSLWAGSRGALTPAGPFTYLTTPIILLYNRPCQTMIRQDQP
jgi:hypothetical protein